MRDYELKAGLRVRIMTRERMLAGGAYEDTDGDITTHSADCWFDEDMDEFIGREGTIDDSDDGFEIEGTDYCIRFDDAEDLDGYSFDAFMFEPIPEGDTTVSTEITSQIAALEAQVAKLKAEHAASLKAYRWYTATDIPALLTATTRSIPARLKNGTGATTIRTVYVALSDRGTIGLGTTCGPDIGLHNFQEFEMSLDGEKTWIPVGVAK